MNNIFCEIENYTGLSEVTQYAILKTLLILVIILIIRRIIFSFVARFNPNIRNNYRIRSVINYITYGITLLLVGRIWFSGIDSLATYLGLLTAGLAIALKELILNIAGWLFIIFRGPFKVGDRIEISKIAGDVVDVSVFQFTLNEVGNWVHAEQSTGRLIHIPNAKVFSEPVANYTTEFNYIWHEIALKVTFESNWKKAKTILQNIATKHTAQTVAQAEKDLKNAKGKYLLFYSNLTPIVYTSMEENGVQLTLRYLCPPRKRRGSQETIQEAILTEFQKEADIHFAFLGLKIIGQPPN